MLVEADCTEPPLDTVIVPLPEPPIVMEKSLDSSEPAAASPRQPTALQTDLRDAARQRRRADADRDGAAIRNGQRPAPRPGTWLRRPPTTSLPGTLNSEPASATVATPTAPLLKPIDASGPALTVPPVCTFIVPWPFVPMTMLPWFTHADAAIHAHRTVATHLFAERNAVRAGEPRDRRGAVADCHERRARAADLKELAVPNRARAIDGREAIRAADEADVTSAGVHNLPAIFHEQRARAALADIEEAGDRPKGTGIADMRGRDPPPRCFSRASRCRSSPRRHRRFPANPCPDPRCATRHWWSRSNPRR